MLFWIYGLSFCIAVTFGVSISSIEFLCFFLDSKLVRSETERFRLILTRIQTSIQQQGCCFRVIFMRFVKLRAVQVVVFWHQDGNAVSPTTAVYLKCRRIHAPIESRYFSKRPKCIPIVFFLSFDWKRIPTAWKKNSRTHSLNIEHCRTTIRCSVLSPFFICYATVNVVVRHISLPAAPRNGTHSFVPGVRPKNKRIRWNGQFRYDDFRLHISLCG